MGVSGRWGRRSYRMVILLRNAFLNLKGNDPLRLAGATAFFTFFALPSLLIIVGEVHSVLFQNSQAISRGKLFRELSLLLGRASAGELKNISENLQEVPLPPVFTLVGVGFVVLVSTTLLVVIKGSLNQLWNVKAKPKHSLLKQLRDRAIGVGIILFTSLLVTAYLAVDNLLEQLLPWSSLPKAVLLGGHYLVVLLLLTLWAGSLFTFLPDAVIPLKAVSIGALLTGVLLLVGGWGLEKLLVQSPLSRVYGTSGALIITLLFMFYASFIFYYGAAFSRTYALYAQMAPKARPQAVTYQIKEVEE